MFKRLGLLLSALILVVAACGDDGPSLSGEEQEYADGLAADLIADQDNPIATDAEAGCVAEAMVSDLGISRLGELGIEPGSVPDLAEFGPEMSDAEQDAFVDDFFDCVDVPGAMATAMSEDSGGVFSQSDAECVIESIGDDALREGMAAELDGEEWEPGPAALFAGLQECVDVPDLIMQSMLEQGVPEAQAQCIADGLDDSMVESLFADMVAGEAGSDPTEMPGFMQLVMSCMGG